MIFNGFFRQTRTKVVFSIITFLGLGLIVLFWGFNKSGPIPAGPYGKADLGIGDFSFIQTKEGRVQWEIKAKKAEVFGKEETLFMQEIEAKFMTPEGSSIQLTGDRGKMNTQTHDFLIEKKQDPLKISMDNGLLIMTDRLNWSNRQNQFISEEPVQIFGDGISIQGEGLIANIPSQEIRILKRVKAVVQTNGSKGNKAVAVPGDPR